MEKKLTVQEVERIVDACNMSPDAVARLVSDAKGFFASAADDKVTITRQMLRDNLWILKELVAESPSHIVHADSTLGCHTFQ